MLSQRNASGNQPGVATAFQKLSSLAEFVAGFEGYRRDWNAVNTMRMNGAYTDQASLPGVRMLVGGLYAQHRRVIGKLQMTAGARLDVAGSQAP